MEYILLRDYYPFKAGQIVRLGAPTAAKLQAAGVVAPYPQHSVVPERVKIQVPVPGPISTPRSVPEAVEAAIEAAITDAPIATRPRRATTRTNHYRK